MQAISGSEAIDKVKESIQAGYRYKAIFIDVNMPEMNGCEATRKILQLQKSALVQGKYNDLTKISMIFGLSGDSDDTVLEGCKKSGMADLLMKPCSKKTVMSILKRHGIKLIPNLSI